MAACFLVHTDVHVFSMEIVTGSNRTSSLRSSALCSIVKFLQGLFVTYRNMCFLFASGLMFPQSIGTPSSSLNPWKTAPAGCLILLHLVASKSCPGQALIMSSFRLPCHRSTSLQPPSCCHSISRISKYMLRDPLTFLAIMWTIFQRTFSFSDDAPPALSCVPFSSATCQS